MHPPFSRIWGVCLIVRKIGYVLDPRMPPDESTVFDCLQKSFPSVIPPDPPTALRGGSCNPVSQLRRLQLTEGSDLPKVTSLKAWSQGFKLAL